MLEQQLESLADTYEERMGDPEDAIDSAKARLDSVMTLASTSAALLPAG